MQSRICLRAGCRLWCCLPVAHRTVPWANGLKAASHVSITLVTLYQPWTQTKQEDDVEVR